MRHTFESGNWIDVLPIQALKAKHKDAAEAAIRLYVSFDADGNPDLSQLPLSMSLAKAQQHVLMAVCIRSWSFTTCQFDDDGNRVEGTEGLLPVPEWYEDGATGTIKYEESFGELDIDDAADLEEFFRPYMEKIKRRPDPKGTTTSSSNGSSRERVKHSQRG
jgi:hypothetical protein